MLSKAALRSLREVPISRIHARPSASIISATRLYANSSRPPRPPPSPTPYIAKVKAPNTQRPHLRQTSPGTSVPRDESTKSHDAVGAGAAGAAATGGVSTQRDNVRSPVEGARPLDSTSNPQQPIEKGVRPAAQEPIAQQANIDGPPAGGLRDHAQSQQATSENTPPPPEPPSEPQPPQAESPQQPLPDLRQGIPSTFDIEFGQGRQPKAGSSGQSHASSFDITEQEAESSGRRGGEEEDYRRADHQTSVDRRRAKVQRWTYFAFIAVFGFGGAYYARPYSQYEEVPPNLDPADADGWSPIKMYHRVQARSGDKLGYYTEPSFPKLLPTVPENQRQPFTLVLSLEDLLIHNNWDRSHGYRVAKRPGLDYFIRYLSQYYELVLFTSTPIAIADPIIKKLDPYHFIMWPLGREATKYENGEYIKDLSYLNRDLKKTLIIDTHAGHVRNQPDNAIILSKWSGDAKDAHTNDLVALIPLLEYIATMGIDDVRNVINSFKGTDIPAEFARREAVAREKFNKQLAEEQAKRPKRSLGALFGGGLGIKAERAGSMVFTDGQSVSEGLLQGKMLSDQIREQGQRQYEHLEKQIREHGAQWLKEEEEEQKKMMDAQMKEMKKNPLGVFGLGAGPPKE